MVIMYWGWKVQVMFNGEVEICFLVVKNSDLNKSDILSFDYIEVIFLIIW